MGVGKTTIGHQLSQLLGIDFIDLDDEITTQAGLSIPEIFRNNGEDHFRMIEKKILAQLNSHTEPAIIALGGGTICDPENRKLILQNNICIYLHKTWEEIEKSLSKLKNRPLIDQNSPSKLKALYSKRQPIYELSQLKMPINTEFEPQKLANYLKLLTNR